MSETKKYSVLDLISEFYKGNLDLRDKAITDNILAWLLNKFDDYLSVSDNPQDESYNLFKKLKDIMEDIIIMAAIMPPARTQKGRNKHTAGKERYGTDSGNQMPD